MDERARKYDRRTPMVFGGHGGRVALGSSLGLLLISLALWMGCAEEPVSPSAPPFEPNLFLETVTASPGQMGVGGATATISATVVDRDGVRVAGVPVSFNAESWGTITEKCATDSTGVARALFTSGSMEGLARITATVEAFSKSTVILIGQGSLEAFPSILLANGIQTSTITAQVIGAAGQADSGSVVSFQTTAGSITPRGVADAAGVVKATLTTTASAEDISAVITATMESGDPESENEPFGITLVTFKGLKMTVDSSPLLIPADGSSEATIRASLKETSSKVPIANEFVRFATDRGEMVGQVQTDERGQAESQLTSSLSPGTATVIASYGNTLSDTVEVVFSSLELSLSGSPSWAHGDGVSEVEIRAILKDLGGEALTQRTVEFDSDIGTVSARDTTSATGLALATFTAPSSATDTTAVVSVTALGVTSLLEIPIRGLSLMGEADPASLVADGSSQSEIQITLVEAESGLPLGSRKIRLETNLGTVDSVAVTNSSGIAAATFHGGSHTGTATLVLEYGDGLTSSLEIELVAANVASVVLSCRPGAIFADGFSSAEIQAFVKDTGNRAVPDGLIVSFYTSGGLITAQAHTIDGVANAILRSGTMVEANVEIVAVCQGVSDTTHVDFVPGVPATMQLTVSPDSIPADGTTTASLVATVQDSIGHPVEDKTLVTFRIIVGLADTVAADTVIVSSTTSGGMASTSYTAATRAGLAMVTAAAGAVVAEATLVLTASGVSSIVLSADESSITVRGVGGVETARITAEVRDKNGNPVEEGTEVDFSIVAGPGGPTEENLNNQGWGPVQIPTANGRASVTLSAGTKSGVVGVSAVCAGIEALDAEITIDSGPPDTLTTSVNLGLVAEGGDGTYFLIVSSIVKDVYGNPVEDGTAVYYDLDPSPPHVMIEGNAYTGNPIDCNQTWPAPAMEGVARTCLSYASEDVFETVGIRAHTFNGSREIENYYEVSMPLVAGELLMVASPTTLSEEYNTSVIAVTLLDKYAHFIDGAVIDFYSDSGGATCSPFTAVTDESGMAGTLVTVAFEEDDVGLLFSVKARVRNTSVETTVDLKVE